jgi:bacteriocin-like protein
MSEETKKPAEELSEEDLKSVTGGATNQLQDMTNNQASTGQKSAEKNDAYIRS